MNKKDVEFKDVENVLIPTEMHGNGLNKNCADEIDFDKILKCFFD